MSISRDFVSRCVAYGNSVFNMVARFDEAQLDQPSIFDIVAL